MKFTKYSSIENSYREKYINQIIEQGYGNEEYVVLSKLDGANFSFICNGKNLLQASRNDKVGTDFFNCESVVNKYKQDIYTLFELLNHNNQVEQIQVYGELIGDGINNRVKYCKGREFVIFDILVEYKEPVIRNIKNVYLDYDIVIDLVSQTNLLLTPKHFVGNLRECLDYCTSNIVFNSLIPNLLNNEYKDLELNYEEGYVIKPVEYTTLKTGDRVILKCKSPEFKESSNKGKPPAKIVELTEEENNTLTKLTELITESRVYSVVSKLGVITDKDFGKLLGLYIKDVIEDFIKDNVLDISKSVNKQLNKKCADCIRSIWTKLI